jgi:MtN3 and saliva related transmembrane protein
METIHIGIIGFIAGTCTTISFIPQILKILKTGKVRDISVSMYVVLTTGIFLWFVYGIFLGALPVVAANGVSLVLCLWILVMKFVYGRKDVP